MNQQGGQTRRLTITDANKWFFRLQKKQFSNQNLCI